MGFLQDELYSVFVFWLLIYLKFKCLWVSTQFPLTSSPPHLTMWLLLPFLFFCLLPTKGLLAQAQGLSSRSCFQGSEAGRCLHLPLEYNSDWWVLIGFVKSIHPIVCFCFEDQATIKLKTVLYFWNLKFQTMHLWIIYEECVFSNVQHKMEWMCIHTCPELSKVHANKQSDNLTSLLPCKIYSASPFFLWFNSSQFVELKL